MPRPRTVQSAVLARFYEASTSNFSTLELLRMMPGYDASQISHAVSALLHSEELEKVGKRRNVFLEAENRYTKVQYYKLSQYAINHSSRPNQSACVTLGIDQSKAADLPFVVTEDTLAHFSIQHALVGGNRRREMVRALKTRYGGGPGRAESVQLELVL